MSASLAPDSIITGPGFKSAASSASRDFTWRVFRLLNAFRLIIAVTLTAVFVFIREPRIVGDADFPLAASMLAAMLVFSVAEYFLLRRRWPGVLTQAYLQFGVDLITLVMILHASGGIVSGLGGLLIVSIGVLALLIPLDRALLLAAVATFVLLGEQALSYLRGFTALTDYTATGVLAAVIFVISGVVQLVRRRIVETEALAEQRGVDLRNLVELNDYVIQHLRESIVVVDGENRIRLINESGVKLLGIQGEAHGRRLADPAPVLDERLNRWRRGEGKESESTIVLDSDDHAARIHPHFAGLGPDRQQGVAVFLEDTSLIQERVQQTKLAALGRLSASIAHEIRNPIGAMSHAGQLLAESQGLSDGDRRLTDIIRINSERVSRIVENVLSLSRTDKTRPQRIGLKQWLGAFADEFTRTQELFEGTVALRPESVEVEVEMDRTHLHQVLWNLCDNAVKYASEAAGAISVELCCGTIETSGRPFVDVMDSGPGVDANVVEQIFEPFYTAQPGGTGLGLYISRELCERNRASLRYHPRHSGGSVFRIIFSDPNRWHADVKA